MHTLNTLLKHVLILLHHSVYQHGTSRFNNIPPLFVPKKFYSCQIVSTIHMHRLPQVTLQTFSWIEVWALNSHSETLTFFWLSHVYLDVFFGWLLCWKINIFFLVSYRSSGRRKAALTHDAPTTMLHLRYGVHLMMCFFLPNTSFEIMQFL